MLYVREPRLRKKLAPEQPTIEGLTHNLNSNQPDSKTSVTWSDYTFMAFINKLPPYAS